MTATATRATVHTLPTPATLADRLPATVALDGWNTATCHECGTDLGEVQTLTTPWVDLDAIDDEIHELMDDHLTSGEARPECGA
ncbi:hypothetical protein [Nocardiopsis alba]|uniref:hypothetical protein n=1 Tax=Nocardiopsis alba TaxID=53437 RepID=UPI0033B6EC41